MRKRKTKLEHCEYCLTPLYAMVELKFRWAWLEIHHIRPKHCGGNNTKENLITLCRACHIEAHTEINGRINFRYYNPEKTLEFLELKEDFKHDTTKKRNTTTNILCYCSCRGKVF